MIDDIDDVNLAHGRAVIDFGQFVRLAWPHVEPGELVWEPYLDDICDHLEAVADDRITKLIVNIPPRHLKSLLVSVLFPAWVWIRKPSYRFVCVSHTAKLAWKFATLSRTLVESPWYTEWFRGQPKYDPCKKWELRGDQNTKDLFETTKGGHRASFGLDSKITGHGGDALLLDDLVDAADCGETMLQNAIDAHQDKLMSRFNDPRRPREILVMQRLHDNDPTGHLLRTKPGVYQHLCLPAAFDPTRPYSTKLNDGTPFRFDRRKVDGEPLAPGRFDAATLAKMREEFSDFEGQYQQRPMPREGGIIKRDWFRRRWVLPGDVVALGHEAVPLPDRFDVVRAYVDAAFTVSKNSDRVAIVVIGSKGPNQYVLDTVCKRMSFLDSCDAIRELKETWPMLSGVGVEQAANGHAIIETLKQTMPGVYGIKTSDKVARINAITGYLKAGNVILPAHAGWVQNSVAEACNFPRGQHDDWIDALSYGLLERLGGVRTPSLANINAR